MTPDFIHTYVHPCIINQQPHIVYPRGLEKKSPGLFKKLTQYYQKQGYRLKEDQRSELVQSRDASDAKYERRKWVPILLFTASLFFESSAYAEIEVHVSDSNIDQQQVELQLISGKDIRQRIADQVQPAIQLDHLTKIKSDLAQSLYETLIRRYKKQATDPDYITDDIKQIANYYSDFPETIALLNALKDKNWQLQFDEDNWVTTGSGNMLQVEKAVIHFNTRSAAQLRLNNRCDSNPVCIASPADALLHELLHTHSMLVKSEEFIAQGGMNNVVYPYKHEYSIIDAERELYASMSQQDKVKRPQRREHTGRMVKAHCPTCIK